MPVSSTPLLYIWRILRDIQRLKRKVFGAPTPHWVKDLSRPIPYINILELAPTFLCTILAPQHFFRRLPQYINGGRNPYKTPVAFFSRCIVLLSLGISFATSRVGVAQVKHIIPILLIVSLVTPMWISSLSVFVAGLSALSKAFVDGRPIGEFHDFSLDLSVSLIPLELSAYSRLRGARYLWGMLYFVWYIWVVSALALLVLAAAEAGVVSVLGTLYWSEFRSLYAASGLLPGLLVLIGFMPALWLLRRALLEPYVYLLCASVKYPTRGMQRFTIRQIQRVLRRNGHDRTAAHYLIARWQAMRFDMLCNQQSARGISAEASSDLCGDWAAVYGENDFIDDVYLLAGRFRPMSNESRKLEAVVNDLRMLARGILLPSHNQAETSPSHSNAEHLNERTCIGNMQYGLDPVLDTQNRSEPASD